MAKKEYAEYTVEYLSNTKLYRVESKQYPSIKCVHPKRRRAISHVLHEVAKRNENTIW